MIGYTSLGTNNLDLSAKFYDELFSLLNVKRLMEVEDFIVWGTDFNTPCFSIHVPFDGNPATVGNGVMVALNATNRETVKTVYNTALELGASCEGEPGPRGDTGFYAAYFRDLDGNKLNIHCMS
ncbi:VOC family protein [Kiloniella majae]|uniref:VOC family protein n=1 Tax=Kiloniella majae TaxID=1938558 RepID=UPI000A278144|nr:VOC family protein [Kiloniella majae]